MRAPAYNAPRQASRRTGRILAARWQIERQLARGGVGTVYVAHHVTSGQRVALKVLHPELTRDEDIRRRFLQEGYAANKVGHAGVVRILEDGVAEDGAAFLVMELLEGEHLEARRLRLGGRLPLAEVHGLALQLLDVLAAAHHNGIVHRDIKPENLFVTHEGQLKVLDFGFARIKTGSRKEQTATGFLVGTPGFMAPEQALGEQSAIDERTDIWAVGASLFMLLTGEAVHPGETIAEMLVASANIDPRSIATLDPTLPRSIVAVVDRALARDKAKRFASADEMRRALGPALDVAGVPAPPRMSLPTGPPMQPVALEAAAPVSAAPTSVAQDESAGFLTYVLMAGTTMLVVILIGLVVLVASD